MLAILVAASLSMLAACDGEDRFELNVDVKTDFAPGVEFTRATVEVFRGRAADGARPASTIEVVAHREDTASWLEGRRTAEIASLRGGEHEVRVTLVDSGGATVARRSTLLQLRRNHVLVVVISRACRDVACPGPADPAESTTCFAGRCVDPRCSPERPDLCGEPDCRADSDCAAPPAACAQARCAAGACLASPVPGACTEAEWCRPETGCEPLPSTPDAGPRDSGPPDSGPRDAGLLDAGSTGPCLPRVPVAPDTAPHPPPGLAVVPAGGTFVDPTFGTTIRRVTGSGDAQTGESYLPAFNADSTRILVRERASSVLYSLDPATGATAFVGDAWPSDGRCRFTEAFWSRTDPDIIFCHEYGTPDVYELTVSTATTRLIRSITERPGGYQSEDFTMGGDDVFVLHLLDAGGTGRGALVYDRTTDAAYTKVIMTTEVGDVSADLAGRVVVLTRMDGLEFWDFRAGTSTFVPRDATGRGCGGSHAVGRTLFIGVDCYDPQLLARRLADPRPYTPIFESLDPAGEPRWGQESGFSLLHDGRFVLASHWTDSTSDRAVYDPWEEEILAIATDGSWILPLAHHRSDALAGGYAATPRATISYDGRWIAFTSTFAGGPDVYVMRVPRDCP